MTRAAPKVSPVRSRVATKVASAVRRGASRVRRRGLTTVVSVVSSPVTRVAFPEGGFGGAQGFPGSPARGDQGGFGGPPPASLVARQRVPPALPVVTSAASTSSPAFRMVPVVVTRVALASSLASRVVLVVVTRWFRWSAAGFASAPGRDQRGFDQQPGFPGGSGRGDEVVSVVRRRVRRVLPVVTRRLRAAARLPGWFWSWSRRRWLRRPAARLPGRSPEWTRVVSVVRRRVRRVLPVVTRLASGRSPVPGGPAGDEVASAAAGFPGGPGRGDEGGFGGPPPGSPSAPGRDQGGFGPQPGFPGGPGRGPDEGGFGGQQVASVARTAVAVRASARPTSRVRPRSARRSRCPRRRPVRRAATARARGSRRPTSATGPAPTSRKARRASDRRAVTPAASACRSRVQVGRVQAGRVPVRRAG